MKRSRAVTFSAAAALLLVFASTVLALNAGMFSAGADNVGKLTPASAAPAPPTGITVYADPTASTVAGQAPTTRADDSGTPAHERRGEANEKDDHHGRADDDD